MSPADNLSLLEQSARDVFVGFKSYEGGEASYQEIYEFVRNTGISPTDPRLEQTMKSMHASAEGNGGRLSLEQFVSGIESSYLLSQAVQNELAIPDFPTFQAKIKKIYEETKRNCEGQVATYIPQLARQDPKKFAVSLCSTDGQVYNLGDYEDHFCIQSTSKPVTYCLGMEEHGESVMHSHVGREPSGRNFNERVLNADGLPHNPLINSGAIMCASLVKPNESDADRFDHVMRTWERLSGGIQPGFDNTTYLSEKSSADRNFCLGYMMKETSAFPEGTDLVRTLEFYFQLCSITMTCEGMAVVAATLANGGVCPMTGERVFQVEHVRACLSLMMSCGMYDYSGLFGWKVGLPAKSGVAGAVMCVIPGVCGFCTWSPPLDNLGNSVRGIDFFTRLTTQFPFHLFDSLVADEHGGPKKGASPFAVQVKLFYACASGDLLSVKEMVARDVDVNCGDYDQRTALHLAASEGHLHIVKYLLCHGASPGSKDRFGNSPLEDAERHGHVAIRDLLAEFSSLPLEPCKVKDNQANWFAYVDENGDQHGQRAILLAQLARSGISLTDSRLKEHLVNLGEEFNDIEFASVVGASQLLQRIIRGELAIPEWATFVQNCTEIFEATRSNRQGNVATYIPQLACVDPEKYGMSVCTVDGQQASWGDYKEYFCVQSSCKPINYCIAQDLNGVEKVHEHVGREPSGRNFNELALNTDGRPHNPLINAGAIMTCSLVKASEELSERFDYVSSVWKRLSGGSTVKFSNSTYLSERQTASRNFCLGYLMKERGIFPEKTDLKETLEFYFQLCSLEMTCESMAVVAATLANGSQHIEITVRFAPHRYYESYVCGMYENVGGVCPITEERVFSATTVKNCLSLMLSCGMYDFSGECQYLMGFPAKSGVSGVIMCVIPNVAGFCIWSPRLDGLGNSVRGLEVMARMGRQFTLHMFDIVTSRHGQSSTKIDPTEHSTSQSLKEFDLISAAATGDLSSVRGFHVQGVSLNAADYDSRTALHVAAANGKDVVVKYLLDHGANPLAKDRWGVTPFDEAKKHQDQNVLNVFSCL